MTAEWVKESQYRQCGWWISISSVLFDCLLTTQFFWVSLFHEGSQIVGKRKQLRGKSEEGRPKPPLIFRTHFSLFPYYLGAWNRLFWVSIERMFTPIATAHFFAHVTHTSCIADHVGKHNAKGANIFHKNGMWKRVASWDGCGPRSSRKCQVNDVTVRIDNHFENFAAILLAWMLGDPHFSFRRSLPLILNFVNFNKKQEKSVHEKLQIFHLLHCMLLCDRSFRSLTIN